MLKTVPQPRSAASSPTFHYAPASQSSPTTPVYISRRPSKAKPRAQLNPDGPAEKTPPLQMQRARYADASTQWESPVMNLKTEPSASDATPEGLAQPEQIPETVATVMAPSSPSKPILEGQSPASKRRQSPGGQLPGSGSGEIPSLKRARSDLPQVKVLPAKYEFCEVEDMVVLIANMISELIQTNDGLPLRSGVLTRFHSRTPPGISVFDYLQRLAKHATLTPPLLLSMVYYIDRLCSLYPAFTVTTLTIHRFLITAATVAAKGLSDSFWNNTTYARVGGIKVAELGLLELDFLYRVDWKIVPNPEVLVDYYRGLVERSEGYTLEDDSNPTEEEEDKDGDVGSSGTTEDSQPKIEGATDVQWKAWMEDVSTRKAGIASSSESNME
ncbi:uncharacterized protein BP5553_02616 [Venustampulla echinocandica]|uniref:Cyclin-domain-containing protein n=1 Tax=Venustampulla echinocandica TaxID=2656787 RepID=A0A370TRW4_9HELO|nr:uncharacterized protein BP5553_02616 [Venustampulla echinocandica]RDL38276.1 hypothetical protein BP5553_02616 [Venustampulla echinocandica]